MFIKVADEFFDDHTKARCIAPGYSLLNGEGTCGSRGVAYCCGATHAATQLT